MDSDGTAPPAATASRRDLPAARSPDAAVRRAIVESRNDLLRYLTRRIGSADAAAEILQTFAERALKRSAIHPATRAPTPIWAKAGDEAPNGWTAAQTS